MENYEKTVVALINKVLKDEISASIAYHSMAELTENGKLAAELTQHGDEEYGHYKKILSFVFSHGLEDKVSTSLDMVVANSYPRDTAGIIAFTQNLETNAINDYRGISLIARENKDIETEDFFSDLMQEEQGHFDDLARYDGQRRKIKSFKDMVGV